MKSWILTAILAFPLFAQAKLDVQDCSREMKALASAEIQKAINNGWSQIGNTSLTQIKGIVESQNVKIWCGETPLKSFGERGSAYWRNANGLQEIILNEEALGRLHPHYKQYTGSLVVHEILGATQKIDDINYQYSTRIRRMTNVAFEKRSALDQSPLKRGGGSNGVGGGGDAIDLAFKDSFYEGLEIRLKNDRPEYREMILKEFLDLELRLFRRDGALDGPRAVADTFDKNLQALTMGINYVNKTNLISFLDSVITICHSNSLARR